MPTRGKRTRADQVLELLKARILSGELAPGDKLPPEVALAEELSVHRFTVREAMNKLEELRLIERRPRVGTVVLDYRDNAGLEVVEYLAVSPDGMVDTTVLAGLLEFARMLTKELAGLAAERRSDDDLARLTLTVAKMQGEKNLSKLLWLDFEFNLELAQAAHNIVPRLLLNSVRGLLEKYTPYLETLWVSPGSITEGYEHVVDAIRRRDRERAKSLVLWIWTGRHQRFVESFER
ncbi:MAG: FadR family transcriptional regulator [Myxococcales bacterium]|nr:FadR family transcriptional regulator [Myxococcales bacterium]MCB9577545.1 FadR family transcriptional regulator [Polyangiaceae bacterium]